MIARQVSMVLKADCTAQITRTIKNEVIPLLRKQKGFKDETTFVVPDGTEAIESRCGITRRKPQPITAQLICRCWNFWRE